MGILYEALIDLAPERDEVLLDGYRRYEAQVATVLTPAQMEAYAAYIRQTNELPVFDAMSSTELAMLPPTILDIARVILTDTDSSMENRRVAALLHARGEDDVAGPL